MGRSPCCDKQGLKKGPWTSEEDRILVDFIHSHGHGSWRSLPRVAGLQRCGKSCRLRWTNYLRPDIKRGPFTADEQKAILQLHGIVGNKWSTIAVQPVQLPGRTDNEIKNYWNTHMKKRLVRMGLDPDTYAPAAAAAAAATRHMAQWESARLEAEARLSRESILFSACSDQKQKRDQQDCMLPAKAEPDVFLRMWNSEVGDAFRRSKMSDEEASSTRHESGVTVSAADGGHEDSKSCCCSDSGGSSSVAEEEAYRMYLDLSGGGGGDEISLLHGQFGSYTYSLFAGDIKESLDAAFE